MSTYIPWQLTLSNRSYAHTRISQFYPPPLPVRTRSSASTLKKQPPHGTFHKHPLRHPICHDTTAMHPVHGCQQQYQYYSPPIFFWFMWWEEGKGGREEGLSHTKYNKKHGHAWRQLTSLTPTKSTHIRRQSQRISTHIIPIQAPRLVALKLILHSIASTISSNSTELLLPRHMIDDPDPWENSRQSPHIILTHFEILSVGRIQLLTPRFNWRWSCAIGKMSVVVGDEFLSRWVAHQRKSVVVLRLCEAKWPLLLCCR